MTPISLRTETTELKYQSAKPTLIGLENEKSKKEYLSMRIVENAFGYDLVYQQSDIAIPKNDAGFIDFWFDLGLRITRGQFNDYDQIVFNLPHNQSQPHIPHVHLMKFNKERIEVLRTLLENWRENNE